MSRLSPVSPKLWIKFIEKTGCRYVRQKGDHLIYWKEGIKRPVVFRSRGDIPVLHIKTNLKTLGITTAEFLKC